MMYFNGQGAGLNMDIVIEKTDRFTVEFWFRADLSKQNEMNG